MLLRVDAAELADRIIDVRPFSPASAQDRLIDASDNAERVVLLLRFVGEKADAAAPYDEIVRAGIQLIDRTIRSVRVSEVRHALDVSERQLERRFLHVVGVTPYRYIRRVRFQEAIRRLRACGFERLSDLAYELGYADQSHFIKEFKEMSGHTPTALVRYVRDWVPEQQAVAGRIEPSRQPDGSAGKALRDSRRPAVRGLE